MTGLRSRLGQQRALPVLILLVALFGVLTPDLLSTSNLTTVLYQVAIDGCMALGMTLLLVAGAFDLSIGSVLAMSSLVAVMATDVDPRLGIIVPILFGASVGLFNGVFVAVLRINPFIVTLGSMTAVRGLALMISGESAIRSNVEGFAWLGSTNVLFVPLPAIMLAIFAGAAFFTLGHTSFGRGLYAIGGSERAARLAGIPVTRYVVAAFVLGGVLASIAGVVAASRLSAGSPILGTQAPLTVMAAVVLGGASLQGGEGGALRSLQGVLVLQVLSTGLSLLGLLPYWQLVAQGLVLVTVVVADGFRVRRRARHEHLTAVSSGTQGEAPPMAAE